jgi:hypothetical protein
VNLSAQESSYKFTKDGLTDYIVNEHKGKTQYQLYNSTLDWLDVNFDKKEKVIVSKIKNDEIKIEGSDDQLVCFGDRDKLCNKTKFKIVISFKEGKTIFDLQEINYYRAAKKSEREEWVAINIENTSIYFNKKGELRKNYKHLPEIANYMNKVNEKLKNYIDNKSNSDSNNNW